MTCYRDHGILPGGHNIVRCLHGRIGTTNYVVIDAVDPQYPQAGFIRYSAVPALPTGCSLALFHDYDRAMLARGIVFDSYMKQLMDGATPLTYTANFKDAAITSVRHSQESITAMRLHGVLSGMQVISSEDNHILQGRVRPATRVN